MSKERLSKLQEWILKNCLENVGLRRDDIFCFYGKKFSERYKTEKIRDYQLERELRWHDKDDFDEKEDYFWTWDFKEKKQVKEKAKYYMAKGELIITRSEQAIISRCLKNLVKKGC